MGDNAFIAMYIGIDIFLAVIWWVLLDVHWRLKDVEKFLHEIAEELKSEEES